MRFKHRNERGSSVPRYPESARRPRVIVVRAAGGREQGAYRQARAFAVEPDGSARLLALTHTRIRCALPHVRHYSHNERKAAA
jgi:hypothetical protein